MLKFARYIEKTGMNLSYMKNALRAARAGGVPILRSEEALRSHLGQRVTPSFLKKIPFIGENLHNSVTNRTASALNSQGPAAVPGHNFIYMPRDFTTGAGQNYSPRAMLLHELGHIQHIQEDPKAFGAMYRLNRVFGAPANVSSRTNLAETIANNNAIIDMRRANVPEHLIDTYKTRVQSPFHNSYGRFLEDMANSPTGNMYLPRRILHSATQRVSDIGKNIAEKGKTFLQRFKRPKQVDANFFADQSKAFGNASNLQPYKPTVESKAFERVRTLRPYAPTSSFMNKLKASLGKADSVASSSAVNRPAHLPTRQVEVPVFSNKAKAFAPLEKPPIYTHPTAQEFNVPYSV
jgi:hypothetical protein